MKKTLNIILIVALLLNSFFPLFNINVYAEENNVKIVENEKKNENSYWSTTNKPIFYGATKITIKKGMIDKFDVLDSRFRVFAKDFEDGDLTASIKYSGSVDVDKVGTYNITYKVKDSHNNESTLIVPVTITDDNNYKINVERTLYTIPSVWNMDIAEFSRCNYGDSNLFLNATLKSKRIAFN